MNRRNFLKFTSAALLTIGIDFPKLQAKKPKRGYRGIVACENVAAGPNDLLVRFLGTGAAGWLKDHTRRRQSSILLDNKLLIDLTVSALDMIPAGCHPTEVFYTHSHGDHFDPATAIKIGIQKVYLSSTWAKHAKAVFEKAAKAADKPAPEIIPLTVGKPVTIHGLTITPLPANHATSMLTEQALIYLIEKGTTKEHLGVRLLYATDTGNIMGIASRTCGIDPHIEPGRPITGFIMEATIGMGMASDWRMFNHTSVEKVHEIVEMLIEKGRYLPAEGQPAYITHMSRTGWPKTQDELNKKLPHPLRAAYDGLELTFRAQN